MRKCRSKQCRLPLPAKKASTPIEAAGFCSYDCATKHGLHLASTNREKEQRKWVREGREKLKTRRDYEKDCQRDFNRFIRARDAHLPCICCGQWGDDEFWKLGGQWDAGHFLSVGGHPELRFDEANCHKQLKSCNAGEGKYAGKRRTVGDEYRVRLIEKIGQAEVDRLEGPNEAKKYTADEMKAMAAHYRARTRELRKEQEAA
jgi:hypothetical protein